MIDEQKQLHLVSRRDALKAGLFKYFTGKPCPRGGVDERWANSRHCACRNCFEWRKPAVTEAAKASYARNKALVIDRCRQRRAANRERAKEIARAQYLRNKEKIAARYRARYESDRETFLGRCRAYKEKNPHVRVAQDQRRRALEANAAPRWDGEMDDFVTLEAADLAKRREAATGFAWHVDHMVPLQAREACGLHVAANLQVIPASMNLAKNNRMIWAEPAQWLRDFA